MKAYVFPGQGSQSKGMGAELFDEFKLLTDKADSILGYSIAELCLEDPKEELGQTQFTQPAIYVVNALSYYKAIAEGEKPDFVAGHSLGEYNALMAAEVFSFETGLMLVKKRGELMSQASGGAMAVVINSTEAQIRSTLKDQGFNNIELANFNTPKQIVISGLKEEIDRAAEFFQDGWGMYIPLKTSGAFHSKFMQSASEEFSTFLDGFMFANPTIKVLSNVTGKPYENGQVSAGLPQQITHSVRWSDSMDYLLAHEGIEIVEIGNGNVLTKMVNDIVRANKKRKKK